MDNYICKIASIKEMQKKWNYEISKADQDKSNWAKWKKENIDNYEKGYIIPYYGILNGFIDYIKSDQEVYPDGTIIEVEYYRKKL